MSQLVRMGMGLVLLVGFAAPVSADDDVDSHKIGELLDQMQTPGSALTEKLSSIPDDYAAHAQQLEEDFDEADEAFSEIQLRLFTDDTSAAEQIEQFAEAGADSCKDLKRDARRLEEAADDEDDEQTEQLAEQIQSLAETLKDLFDDVEDEVD